jgi:parallel beta-helix repeat protein
MALMGVAGILAAAGMGSVAGAATVTCGQVITQNTVLQSNVGPCPTNGAHGIVIGADNITLNLNGRTVIGSSGTGEGAGIYLKGRSGVTITNGTVRDFDGGVVVEGGTRNTVSRMTTRENIGVVAGTRYADGIAILSSTHNRVTRNLVVHNGPLSGIGIYSRVDAEHPRDTSGISTGNLIDTNVVADTNLPRNATINDSDGIRVETMSTGNTIRNNKVTGSGLDGISLFSFAPGNTVRDNVVYDNGFLNPFRRRGDGIRVFGGSEQSVIEGNVVRGNAANGIILHGQFMTRPPVVNSRVVGNVAVDNNRLPPLEQSQLGGPTFDLHDGNPDCDANVWLRNVYKTAFPPCTTAAGARQGSPAVASPITGVTSDPSSSGSSGVDG